MSRCGCHGCADVRTRTERNQQRGSARLDRANGNATSALMEKSRWLEARELRVHVSGARVGCSPTVPRFGRNNL